MKNSVLAQIKHEGAVLRKIEKGLSRQEMYSFRTFLRSKKLLGLDQYGNTAADYLAAHGERLLNEWRTRKA